MGILSHNKFSTYQQAYQEIYHRIKDDEALLSILHELATGELGRFLIMNRYPRVNPGF